MNSRHLQEAKEVLRSPDILERVVRDMDILGYVGERENKMLGYLISISRKLEEPLSGIVLSSSGAGKSRLVDTIQQITPAEDVIFTSRLSTQSLYYMPKEALKHKLLIIEERAGSELADYAIRTLQSKGVLSLAIPVKNQTKFFQVEGPVSILETTASYKINLENISRCFILHLDESPEQTLLIHQYQRLAKSEAGIRLNKQRERIIDLHHNIQRLIKPCPVLIPYAPKLSFPAESPSSRREHQKFLTLIEAVSLLYQYQRKKLLKKGMPFIISSIRDYETACSLFQGILRDSLIIHHPKACLLLSKIMKMGKDIYSRADIAEYTGWADYQVRDNIKYLEEKGILLVIHRQKGKKTLYQLNNQLNLTRPEELGKK